MLANQISVAPLGNAQTSGTMSTATGSAQSNGVVTPAVPVVMITDIIDGNTFTYPSSMLFTDISNELQRSYSYENDVYDLDDLERVCILPDGRHLVITSDGSGLKACYMAADFTQLRISGHSGSLTINP